MKRLLTIVFIGLVFGVYGQNKKELQATIERMKSDSINFINNISQKEATIIQLNKELNLANKRIRTLKQEKTTEFKNCQSFISNLEELIAELQKEIKNLKTISVTDIDGNIYETVIIGKQLWMAENLNVAHFSNGDEIFYKKTESDFAIGGLNEQPCWCYYIEEGWYDQDPYSKKYGKLYNWHTVNDIRNVCPSGWHVPTDSEWTQLVIYLDPSADTTVSYKNNVAGAMKSTTGWYKNGNGTNKSGFNAVGAGYATGWSIDDGMFDDGNGFGAGWWCGDTLTTSYSGRTQFTTFIRQLYYNWNYLGREEFTGEQDGFSVRCIKD